MHGFEKDMKLIASITSNDIVEAACHESAPRTNESLAKAGNEKVRVALQHLTFSTATVPLTDGNNMRLTHFGNAMQRICGPLTVFSTNHDADNYSPEIVKCVRDGGHHDEDPIEHPEMPTLQAMHRNTAASPRSTAVFPF